MAPDPEPSERSRLYWYCEPGPYRAGLDSLKREGITATRWVTQTLRWLLILRPNEIGTTYEQLRTAGEANFPGRRFTRRTRRTTTIDRCLRVQSARFLRNTHVSRRSWVTVWWCAMAADILPSTWTQGRGPMWAQKISDLTSR